MAAKRELQSDKANHARNVLVSETKWVVFGFGWWPVSPCQERVANSVLSSVHHHFLLLQSFECYGFQLIFTPFRFLPSPLLRCWYFKYFIFDLAICVNFTIHAWWVSFALLFFPLKLHIFELSEKFLNLSVFPMINGKNDLKFQTRKLTFSDQWRRK